ncbi:hypothetical protein GY45DRAFT_1349536 [Cubamyces sp. BRFM 1775]|nr:hypothetical protein GY45DRAFT_1349536 [Cubamyces sp. BRFM 1775]
MGAYPLECIPRLSPFALTLSHFRMRHKPVVVQYAPETRTPLLHVSHAKCRLEHASQQALLQRLFQIPELTSYDIEVPTFRPERLRGMVARNLSVALTAAIRTLVIHFRRNQYEILCGAGRADFSSSLQLDAAAFKNLHTVKLREDEPHKRYSDIPLAVTLRPLFSLHHLEDVEFEVMQSQLCIRDCDLEEIALAWHDIRRLVISCAQCTSDPPTLDGLYALADGCRRLEELVLPQLDLENLGKKIKRRPPKVPPPGSRGHPLRVFRITCYSRTCIEDAQAVNIAQCVDSLFPNIDIEQSWKHDNSLEAILGDWYLIWVNITAASALRKVAPSRKLALLTQRRRG